MSQPQRIILGLKTNFQLSPNYSAHKSSNHKFSKIYKLSPNINSHKTKHVHKNTTHKMFEELVEEEEGNKKMKKRRRKKRKMGKKRKKKKNRERV